VESVWSYNGGLVKEENGRSVEEKERIRKFDKKEGFLERKGRRREKIERLT
jgi:hypothetical protein